MNPIFPCVWQNHTALDAANFYCSIFENSKITYNSPVVVHCELDGFKLMLLNGGETFQPNPSISLFITSESDDEIQTLWSKLSTGGKILMDLGSYPWSEHYGWCQDLYGLSWQIYKGKTSEVNQKIVPSLLFTQEVFKRAEEAIGFYSALFPKSEIQGILRYGAEHGEESNRAVMHAQFILNTGVFMAMDGPGDHAFRFSEGVSFVIECENQAEIDRYWDALTTDGGEESMCGWCKDKFGVSWQVVPHRLDTILSVPEKAQKAMDMILQMKKLDYDQIMTV